MTKPTAAQDAAAFTLAGDLRVVLGKLKRKFRAQGSFNELTASQVSVLSHLERDGPATISQLARAEGMRPQSMGAIVTVLEAAGLVQGTPDPTDGRKVLLSLTQDCIDRVAEARAAREDWLFRTIQSEFTAAEQAQLATGIALLKRMAEL
ncbi:MarR family winged helix-turn-helix transcriptional regulator [Lichenifustis flavocetrariae]|uniref:MarR family transcriptional regulator n=1 Tax=Lichenifustis flavocetrariae TaxID=2949735 RepID=A0AA42CKA3_9HYPH|nr:MarR family transcriptional regulator [Lichenifustis flavocetrariae]MCW6510383.1 MarR family transcriptional regulator [Lichenifustis flavocetrariae]